MVQLQVLLLELVQLPYLLLVHWMASLERSQMHEALMALGTELLFDWGVQVVHTNRKLNHSAKENPWKLHAKEAAKETPWKLHAKEAPPASSLPKPKAVACPLPEQVCKSKR